MTGQSWDCVTFTVPTIRIRLY